MLFSMHYGTLGKICEAEKLLFSLCYMGKHCEIINPSVVQTERFSFHLEMCQSVWK